MVEPETYQPRSTMQKNHVCKLEFGIAAFPCCLMSLDKELHRQRR
jgi:hypothetical protein